MEFPLLIPVRQHFPGAPVADVPGAMEAALGELRLGEQVRPGMKVAITAGSRGIQGIAAILRTAAAHVRRLGAEPVLVAAMGSHGGGTAQGQRHVLESLGITEAATGAPVVCQCGVVELGRTEGGLAVYADEYAAGCDGLLVINRIKPHTSFHGRYESGLVKMLVVGLGKAPGAAQFHSLGAHRLSDALGEIAGIMLAKLPVLGGVAVLENARKETAALAAVKPGEFLDREPALLEQARALLPRLPVRSLDLLVVDEMGKNIAGTGMDTNIIGRIGITGVPDREPFIQRIVVLDLTEGSHGNANGMGLADFITRRFQAKIDFPATYLNTLTATFVQRAKMPVVAETGRAAVEMALRTLGSPAPDQVRAIRIRNTLMLEEIQVSPAVWREVQGRPGLEAMGEPVPWALDRSE